ncbi:MAG: deoxyguanosinetriphosphate triphosphohydrolase [Rhodospirillaceae bacterium]|nr:deoxyguanosinetriphosphate triphosphohydrolase [Rhodospirillaceae bacterium]
MNRVPGAFAQSPAPFACRPEDSRGRRHPEPESATRSVFQRDRDRIIHSAAFRRLKHKTQVFVYHEGDNYRTRLTHSLEVSQIARSISRVLGLNEDLAEALALAHDLGHPPFGHAGEDALDTAMQPWGGFDHNAQALRVLTRLEHRYAEFDGLNLTWETLEGVVKHNGPLLAAGPDATEIPPFIAEYVTDHDLELGSYPGAEAQVAALSDDIAYNNHDIDDGLRAELFSIEDLAEVPLIGPLFAEVMERYPGLERSRLIFETIRRMITRMVDDAIAETGRRIAAEKPAHALDVRALGRPLVAHSEELAEESRALRDFLFQNMYRHYKINRMASNGRRIVGELFALYLSEPECLPTQWQIQAGAPRSAATARLACDFIAGMTDRFAADEHNHLFDVYAKI